jgi:uncharacterized membrane protein YfcA
VGQYWRARVLGWREFVGPVVASMIGAAFGVWLAYLLEGKYRADLRPVMLVMLVAMLAFSLLRPDLGSRHAPRLALRSERGAAILIAFALGLYDGFFGPGTGTILIFLFVTVLGFDFVRASALAKGVNWASNIASLVVFVSQGSYVLVLALAMAVGNGLGGYMGARTALARGARWVRVLFILVVCALILRLAWQVLRG